MRLFKGNTSADIRYSMALPIHDTKSGTRSILYFNAGGECIGHGAMADRWTRAPGQKTSAVDNMTRLKIDPK